MLSERFLQDTRNEDSTDGHPMPVVGPPPTMQYSLTSPGHDSRTNHPNALRSNEASPREMDNVGTRVPTFSAEAVAPPNPNESRFEKLRQRMDGIQSPPRDAKLDVLNTSDRKREPFATPANSVEPSPSAQHKKLTTVNDLESQNAITRTDLTANPLVSQHSFVGNPVQRYPLANEDILIEDSKNCAFEVLVMNRWTTPIILPEKGDAYLMANPPELIDEAISKDVNNGYEKDKKIVTVQPNGELIRENSVEEPKLGLLDRFRSVVQRIQVQSDISGISNRFRFYFPELASSAGYTNKNRNTIANIDTEKDFWLGDFQCTTIHKNRYHEGNVILTDKHICFLGHPRRDAFVVRSISSLDSIIGIEECSKKLCGHQLLTSRHESVTHSVQRNGTDLVAMSNQNAVTAGTFSENDPKFFTPIAQRGISVVPEALQIYFNDGTMLQLFDLKSHLFNKAPTQKVTSVEGKLASLAPGKKQEFHFGRLSGEIGMHQTYEREATDLDRFEALLEHAWRKRINK